MGDNLTKRPGSPIYYFRVDCCSLTARVGFALLPPLQLSNDLARKIFSGNEV